MAAVAYRLGSMKKKKKYKSERPLIPYERPPRYLVWNGMDPHARAQEVMLRKAVPFATVLEHLAAAVGVKPAPLFAFTVHGMKLASLADLDAAGECVLFAKGVRPGYKELPKHLRARLDAQVHAGVNLHATTPRLEVDAVVSTPATRDGGSTPSPALAARAPARSARPPSPVPKALKTVAEKYRVRPEALAIGIASPVSSGHCDRTSICPVSPILSPSARPKSGDRPWELKERTYIAWPGYTGARAAPGAAVACELAGVRQQLGIGAGRRPPKTLADAKEYFEHRALPHAVRLEPGFRSPNAAAMAPFVDTSHAAATFPSPQQQAAVLQRSFSSAPSPQPVAPTGSTLLRQLKSNRGVRRKRSPTALQLDPASLLVKDEERDVFAATHDVDSGHCSIGGAGRVLGGNDGTRPLIARDAGRVGLTIERPITAAPLDSLVEDDPQRILATIACFKGIKAARADALRNADRHTLLAKAPVREPLKKVRCPARVGLHGVPQDDDDQDTPPLAAAQEPPVAVRQTSLGVRRPTFAAVSVDVPVVASPSSSSMRVAGGVRAASSGRVRRRSSVSPSAVVTPPAAARRGSRRISLNASPGRVGPDRRSFEPAAGGAGGGAAASSENSPEDEALGSFASLISSFAGRSGRALSGIAQRMDSAQAERAAERVSSTPRALDLEASGCSIFDRTRSGSGPLLPHTRTPAPAQHREGEARVPAAAAEDADAPLSRQPSNASIDMTAVVSETDDEEEVEVPCVPELDNTPYPDAASASGSDSDAGSSDGCGGCAAAVAAAAEACIDPDDTDGSPLQGLGCQPPPARQPSVGVAASVSGSGDAAGTDPSPRATSVRFLADMEDPDDFVAFQSMSSFGSPGGRRRSLHTSGRRQSLVGSLSPASSRRASPSSSDAAAAVSPTSPAGSDGGPPPPKKATSFAHARKRASFVDGVEVTRGTALPRMNSAVWLNAKHSMRAAATAAAVGQPPDALSDDSESVASIREEMECAPIKEIRMGNERLLQSGSARRKSVGFGPKIKESEAADAGVVDQGPAKTEAQTPTAGAIIDLMKQQVATRKKAFGWNALRSNVKIVPSLAVDSADDEQQVLEAGCIARTAGGVLYRVEWIDDELNAHVRRLLPYTDAVARRPQLAEAMIHLRAPGKVNFLVDECRDLEAAKLLPTRTTGFIFWVDLDRGLIESCAGHESEANCPACARGNPHPIHLSNTQVLVF